MDFQKELDYRASDVDRVIVKYLPKVEGYQKTVFEAMRYSILVGGKRVRPILMEETYKLFGGKSKALEPFMAAIEMIHSYSLVHDDLPAMDNDMLRRGNPTTHAQYGEAMGILAGDGLLNFAYETALKAFDEAPLDATAIVRALKVLSNKSGVYGMVGGQVADVEEVKQNGISRNRIDFIYSMKTAALIEAAMMIGSILGGADDEQVSIIEGVAHKIGLAFQIQDDILDVEGDEAVLGKEIGQDSKNQKVTFISFEGMDRAKAEVTYLSDEGITELLKLPYENRFLTKLLEFLVHREK